MPLLFSLKEENEVLIWKVVEDLLNYSEQNVLKNVSNVSQMSHEMVRQNKGLGIPELLWEELLKGVVTETLFGKKI
jgi:hypothetical protein